jgi:hypothetical protein
MLVLVDLIQRIFVPQILYYFAASVFVVSALGNEYFE